MACLGESEVVELVEGSIDPDRRGEVLAHLDACESCRVLVTETTRALMPTAHERKVSADGLPDVGDVIARYRVTARLGAGAMGMVLAAEHLDLRRRVALKIVLPSSEIADDHMRLRLMREARAASAIRHENVVAVHDVLMLEDGSPVMVMDLLEGESLRERLLRVGRLSVEETLVVIRQVLRALEAAHELGVVHRDLKPDNIFVARTDNGEAVKIVDFGIAKLTAVDGPAAETAGLTQTGTLIGTPHYMAPEQAFSDGTIDARADLWAVGVILYECLAGRRPFDTVSVGQTLRRLAQMSFQPIDEVVRGVPAPLSRVVGSLLSEREVRPSSAADVLARLDEVDERSPVEVIATATSPGAVAIDDGSWLTRVQPRSPWYLSMVVVAALAGVAFVAAGGRSHPEDGSPHGPVAAGERATDRSPRAEPSAAAPSAVEPTAAEPTAAEPSAAAPSAVAPGAPSASSRSPSKPAPRWRPPAPKTPPSAAPAPVPSAPAAPGQLLTDPPF